MRPTETLPQTKEAGIPPDTIGLLWVWNGPWFVLVMDVISNKA